jgi:hypothetical protein
MKLVGVDPETIFSSKLAVLIISATLAFTAGVFYAWIVDPIEWVDASAYHLRKDLQLDYLRMAIDSYSEIPYEPLARRRWEELGEAGLPILSDLKESPWPQSTDEIEAFEEAVDVAVLKIPESEYRKTESKLLSFAGLGLVFSGVALAGFLAVMLRRTKAAEKNSDLDKRRNREYATTYLTGDQGSVDSFMIMDENQQVGECGVQVNRDNPGVLDLWLFDKRVVSTSTFYLVVPAISERDRQALAVKGSVQTLSGGSTRVRLEMDNLVAMVDVSAVQVSQNGYTQADFRFTVYL